MTLESIQKRIIELMQHKGQLDAQYKQTEQQIYMLQGHINELQHQMNLLMNPPKTEETEPVPVQDVVAPEEA